jgi:hypothetical protein
MPDCDIATFLGTARKINFYIEAWSKPFQCCDVPCLANTNVIIPPIANARSIPKRIFRKYT